jgi:glycosyltransferase involved in cell wall biosynthesis
MRQHLSIIVPVYNEEATFPEFERRLSAAIHELGFERTDVLLISDGSTDSSEDLIRALVRRNPLFTGVFLTRNFGQQAAISTGIELATGTVVAVMDGDLQDPPEALPDLIDAIDAGADVAYAVRTHRKESAVKRFAYSLFYRILRSASSIPIPLDSGDFCCMRRPVVDAMLKLPERSRFVRGLRAWVGFTQVGVPLERAVRHAGRSKYTFRKLAALAYDGFFSFSTLPIRVIQILGFVASIAAVCIAVAYFVWSLVQPARFPQGFATLTISIWFLGGVQLLFLGVVGEYVARAMEEARRRPVSLVREIVAGEGKTRRHA